MDEAETELTSAEARPPTTQAEKEGASRPQSLPTVTVIIPTYNRAEPLADAINAVFAQDYPADLMELVVVDNSSTDNTEEVVTRAATTAPFPVHFYRKENKGPAASRNYAIARSTGDILAFTDSDCSAPSGWIRKGVAAMASGAGLVAGPIRPVNHPDRIPSFFAHQTNHSREDYIYATANVFYRRDIVTALGGFNERYGAYPWGLPVGGEDTDLAWRVKRAGYSSVFAEDNPVFHEATTVPVASWLIEPVRAQIMPRLVKEFPGLRDGLWNQYFLSRGSALFYLLLIGAATAIARKQAAPLLLTVPWIMDQSPMIGRDIGKPRRWWRIPMKYGLMTERYLVQTAAVLWSSVRYKTPVL